MKLKVERDYAGILLDDDEWCDACGHGVRVGSDADAVALAVALVQATPGDGYPRVDVDRYGDCVMFQCGMDHPILWSHEEALALAIDIIRAVGAAAKETP